jgi:hypothetical protein
VDCLDGDGCTVPSDDDWPNGLRGVSHRVLQATGMVAVQAGCDVTEALGSLKIRAAATGQTLENLALDVLDGVIRFDS